MTQQSYVIYKFILNYNKGSLRMDIREELLERYQQTGKIGFIKPKNLDEAMSIIDNLTCAYEEEPEEVIITLSEVDDKMKKFFTKF